MLTWCYRTLGSGLLLLTLLPVFGLLDRPETGVPGAQTVAVSATLLRTALWGGLTAVVAGLALARVLPMGRIRRLLRALGAGLRRPGPWTVALALGALAGGLAIAASRLLFHGLPTLEDGMASLVHARYLAGWRAGADLPDPGAAWLIPNTVLTPAGWISQYPPLHVALLALGLRLGVPWLVGPVLLAAAVALTCRSAELVLEDRVATARLGGIVVAVSPFLVCLGGGYLSHTSAAAFGALALVSTLKAIDDPRAIWPVLTGLAAGGGVASRPWMGLFLGIALPVGIWVSCSKTRDLLRRLAWASAGGLPVAVALGAYNLHFFGHPLRFGYTAAYGAAHLPGLHTDPWGHAYGLREAVGYTSADLVALAVHLTEGPIPAVAVVGVALLWARGLPRGSGVLLAWALLPIVANGLYWHHGYHLGPRMLYEAAPAWGVFLALSAVALAGSRSLEGPEGSADPEGGGLAFVRDGLLVAFLLAVPAGGLLSVQRALSYRWAPEVLARITPPSVPSGVRAIVFVHGSWPERVAGRLRAAGVDAGTVEVSLRRNDLCTVHQVSLSLTTDPGAMRALSLDNLPGTPSSLVVVDTPAGYAVRRDRGRTWSEDCRREAAADRSGIISVAPLLWQSDLPGLEEGRPLLVRDLGPEANQVTLTGWPDRTPYVWVPSSPDGPPRLLPYPEGMRALW